MIETIINYEPEYISDSEGHSIDFKYDAKTGEFIRDESGELISDPDGRPYRQWRDHIRSANDIWDEIVKVAEIPGTTSAPKLQPIAARIVMLQSGMPAPTGVQVKGPDLDTMEKVGLDIERFLQAVPSFAAASSTPLRIVGQPPPPRAPASPPPCRPARPPR